MIKIKLIDSGRKKVTKQKILTYENACTTFLHYWGITSDIKINLFIDFPKGIFNDKDSNFYKQKDLKNCAGAVSPVSEKEFDVFINRKYIKKNTKDDSEFMDQIIEALSHEFVHVKQYYYKELYWEDNRKIFREEDVTDIPYEELPYEIEAFKYSSEMRLNYYLEQIEMTCLLA